MAFINSLSIVIAFSVLSVFQVAAYNDNDTTCTGPLQTCTTTLFNAMKTLNTSMPTDLCTPVETFVECASGIVPCDWSADEADMLMANATAFEHVYGINCTGNMSHWTTIGNTACQTALSACRFALKEGLGVASDVEGYCTFFKAYTSCTDLARLTCDYTSSEREMAQGLVDSLFTFSMVTCGQGAVQTSASLMALLLAFSFLFRISNN